jgi:uncharacterized protein (DUF1697 family)
MRYAALLRGVNLVKHNRIAMADLRRILGDLGYSGVVTHLASGNAVFSSEQPPSQLEREIGAALAEHAALSCAVMVRTGAELAAAQAANPLGREPDHPSRFFVSFLATEPAPAAAADFAALDVSPDQAWVIGREAYMWCPNGAADTKLSAAFLEKRLGVAGTARNWNTVCKLVTLTAEEPHSPS